MVIATISGISKERSWNKPKEGQFMMPYRRWKNNNNPRRIPEQNLRNLDSGKSKYAAHIDIHGWFYVCTQPMKDGVTWDGYTPRISPDVGANPKRQCSQITCWTRAEQWQQQWKVYLKTTVIPSSYTIKSWTTSTISQSYETYGYGAYI